ncbi:amidohydrolase family protein [Bradyrhizobium sp. WSM 1791]|uniref:Amidohydrolase family protein n=1 Tax=Bradyrhizobium australiense TaxID=2721161 RepID=A0A7Y4GZ09_9BRAD|nr:amidohydrolase family protein [Bradyrhizobium australiense]NOJ44605.1 amidohydrolase family protein [Bradyrhizobium australiense]
MKALQDFLFQYCLGKASECGLPVKLDTGMLGDHGLLRLARTRDNATDLCRLLQDFPETQFVLMHIGYPYENEFIALAKYYPNATIDMCWAAIAGNIALPAIALEPDHRHDGIDWRSRARSNFPAETQRKFGSHARVAAKRHCDRVPNGSYRNALNFALDEPAHDGCVV